MELAGVEEEEEEPRTLPWPLNLADEEDAAGGCTQENVVAEKEHLVGVVMAWSDGTVGVGVASHFDCGDAHLGFQRKD